MKILFYYVIGFSKKFVYFLVLIKYVNEFFCNLMFCLLQMCFVWKLRYMMEEMEGEKNF